MQLNRVSAEIPQDVEDLLVQDLEERRKSLPFLIDLPIEERIAMPKSSRKLVDFIDTGLLQARTHPTYLPSFVDIVEFEKDVKLRKSLRRIYEALNAFTDRVRDTLMVVESEAYLAARVFYKTAKAAAKEGAEDAERIVKEMAYHYKKAHSGEITPDDIPVQPK
ncbi:MAG: hypothetical protein NT166_06375 [Candidatus Aminicenantes bacterium]|nr:hypothetical protein [Candidatus Aminicenantes bacterium]